MRKWQNYIGYGLGDFGLNLYWNSLSLLLIYWYINVMGISAYFAGIIFLIGSIWDAISDPLMALYAEKKKRAGLKYSFQSLLGGIALAVSFLLLFWKPPFEGAPLLISLVFIHIIFRSCYTFASIPYSSLSAHVAKTSEDRTVLSGFRMIFAYGGFLFISLFAFPIIRTMGGREDSYEGFLYFGLLIAVLSLLVFLAFYRNTEEQGPLSTSNQNLHSLIEEWFATVKKNKALHSMLLILFFQASAHLTFFASLVFFLDSYAADLRPKEWVMTSVAVVMLLSTPLWTLIAHKSGKRRTWQMSVFVFALSGGWLFLADPHVISGIPIQILFMAISLAAFGMLIWSMIPDVVEFGESALQIRNEAAVFGLCIFVQKISIGIAGFLVGALLTYIENQPASLFEDQQEGISFLISLLPVILLLGSAVTVLKHPVNRKGHNQTVNNRANKPDQQIA